MCGRSRQVKEAVQIACWGVDLNEYSTQLVAIVIEERSLQQTVHLAIGGGGCNIWGDNPFLNFTSQHRRKHLNSIDHEPKALPLCSCFFSPDPIFTHASLSNFEAICWHLEEHRPIFNLTTPNTTFTPTPARVSASITLINFVARFALVFSLPCEWQWCE